jgi:hypothetical protein
VRQLDQESAGSRIPIHKTYRQVGVAVALNENISFDLQEVPAAVVINEGEDGVGLPEATGNLFTENFDHTASFLEAMLLLPVEDCQHPRHRIRKDTLGSDLQIPQARNSPGRQAG